jgi:hypothetical protein
VAGLAQPVNDRLGRDELQLRCMHACRNALRSKSCIGGALEISHLSIVAAIVADCMNILSIERSLELVHDTPPYTFTAHVVQAAAYVTMYTCMHACVWA